MLYGLKMVDMVLVMSIVILAAINIVKTLKIPPSTIPWKKWTHLAIFSSVALSHLLEGWYLLYGWEPSLMIMVQHFGTAGLLLLWTILSTKE